MFSSSNWATSAFSELLNLISLSFDVVIFPSSLALLTILSTSLTSQSLSLHFIPCATTHKCCNTFSLSKLAFLLTARRASFLLFLITHTFLLSKDWALLCYHSPNLYSILSGTSLNCVSCTGNLFPLSSSTLIWSFHDFCQSFLKLC